METGETAQGKRNIEQLVPADGWAAVCSAGGETTAVPLIAWALTRMVVPAPSGCTGSTECTGIYGVVVSQPVGTGVSFADKLKGFVCYDYVGRPSGEVPRLGGSKLWIRFLSKSPTEEDEGLAVLALASFTGWPLSKLEVRMEQLGLQVQDWWMCEPVDRQQQAEDAAIEHGVLVDLRREPPEEGWPVSPKDGKES